MKRKAVLELGPLMDADPEFQKIREDIYPGAYRNAVFEGKIYGQPILLGLILMYYNKDLFDEKGIPYPDGSWDWNEFLQVCQKLTSEDEQVCGTYVGRDLIWTMIWSNGGRMYDTEKIECLYNSPEVMGALQLAYDYVYKHKISPLPEPLMCMPGGAPLWEGFMAERLATVNLNVCLIRMFKHIKDFEWGIALPPRGKAGNAPWIMGVNYAIYRNTKHPQEAWEFIKFCLSEEVQRLLYEMKDNIPARVSILQSEEYLNYGPGPEVNKVIVEGLSHGYREAKLETMVFGEEWNDYVEQQVAYIFLGEEKVETVCNRIVSEFNERKKSIVE